MCVRNMSLCILRGKQSIILGGNGNFLLDWPVNYVHLSLGRFQEHCLGRRAFREAITFIVEIKRPLIFHSICNLDLSIAAKFQYPGIVESVYSSNHILERVELKQKHCDQLPVWSAERLNNPSFLC